MVFFTLASACFIGAAVVDERSELELTPTPLKVELGTVELETSHRCEVLLKNTGRSAAYLNEARSTCGCAIAEISRRQLRPGEHASLNVTVKAGAEKGTIVRSIYVEVANDEKTLLNVVEIPIRFTVGAGR